MTTYGDRTITVAGRPVAGIIWALSSFGRRGVNTIVCNVGGRPVVGIYQVLGEVTLYLLGRERLSLFRHGRDVLVTVSRRWRFVLSF